MVALTSSNPSMCYIARSVNSKMLVQCLTDTGHLMNMFEAKHGGGGYDLTSRKSWETRMFGDAYDTKESKKGYDTSDHDRPKYGNLNLLTHQTGEMEVPFLSRGPTPSPGDPLHPGRGLCPGWLPRRRNLKWGPPPAPPIYIYNNLALCKSWS